MGFALVECFIQEVDFLVWKVPRSALSYFVVVFDVLIMISFTFTIFSIKNSVVMDSERQKNYRFETSEFAVKIMNLPKVDKNYTMQTLKADLWDHLEEIVKDQPQQIEALENSGDHLNSEIIDI
jgi:uncharacterized membrane protein (DUF106 family)